jgi:hypothetical protein
MEEEEEEMKMGMEEEANPNPDPGVVNGERRKIKVISKIGRIKH